MHRSAWLRSASGKAVVFNRIREQFSERRNLFVGEIELYPLDAGQDGALLGHVVEVVGSPLKLHGEVAQLIPGMRELAPAREPTQLKRNTS
jgi:hypothetical protein